MKRLTFIILFLLISIHANAAEIAKYSFGSCPVTSKDANVTAGDITNASLASFSCNSTQGYTSDPVLYVIGAASATSMSTAVSSNSYFSFVITPAVGYEMDLNSVTFNVARGGTSTPRGWGISSSIDSYASVIDTSSIPTVRTTWTSESVDLTGANYQNLTSAITFRIYIYRPSSSNSVELDDIILNGTVSQITGGGSLAQDLYEDAAPVLTRWIEIERNGTSATAKIYRDNQYSDLADTLTVTTTADTHRYLSIMSSENSGVGGTTFSGSVSDLDINYQSGSTCDEVCTICTTQTTCEASAATCYWWTNNSCNAHEQPVVSTDSIIVNGQTATGGKWP